MSQIKKPLKELDTFEVITQAINFYKAHFINLFTPLLISSVLTGLILSVVSISLPLNLTSYIRGNLNNLIPSVIVFFTAILFATILSWIINMIAGGVTVKYTSSLLEETPINLKESFKIVIRKLPALLGASFISGLLIAIGFMLLVVPGIILSIIFFLFTPAIIIENLGIIASLKRSRNLVAKRWIKTFGILLFLMILIGLASFISGRIQAFLVGSPIQIGFLISSIISALVTPIYFIAMTIYYYCMIAKASTTIPLVPPTIQETKYCIQCGAKIPINAKFCLICGAKQTINSS
ncbi:zinc-ribbon domain-containing protein [Candidatus Bathyarchaeota archaeon]|nr:zinc-ribbon domain-containing protein [Candidatus Bathyarchaeota archaeon]